MRQTISKIAYGIATATSNLTPTALIKQGFDYPTTKGQGHYERSQYKQSAQNHTFKHGSAHGGFGNVVGIGKKGPDIN